MRMLALVVALLFGSVIYAQVDIIPQPANLKTLDGEFSLTSSSNIVYENKELLPSATFLQAYINKTYKLNLKVSAGPVTKSSIVLSLMPPMQSIDGKSLHSYSLNIQPRSFQLGGTSAEAVFNGVQTIIQLLPLKNGAIKIPCLLNLFAC